MTPLRERMLEELCRHNYAPRTGETYLAQIAKLARHFGTSPDQLSREQVQEYQDLLTSQRVSWLPQAVAAMQFLYNKVLERDWKIAHSYRPKARRASVVLTPQEVSRLLAAAEPGKARMLLTTMYGCGLRVSEGDRGNRSTRPTRHANAIAVKRPTPGIDVSSTASLLEAQRWSITFSSSLTRCSACSRSASK